jgi:hypothetical protein
MSDSQSSFAKSYSNIGSTYSTVRLDNYVIADGHWFLRNVSLGRRHQQRDSRASRARSSSKFRSPRSCASPSITGLQRRASATSCFQSLSAHWIQVKLTTENAYTQTADKSRPTQLFWFSSILLHVVLWTCIMICISKFMMQCVHQLLFDSFYFIPTDISCKTYVYDPDIILLTGRVIIQAFSRFSAGKRRLPQERWKMPSSPALRRVSSAAQRRCSQLCGRLLRPLRIILIPCPAASCAAGHFVSWFFSGLNFFRPC